MNYHICKSKSRVYLFKCSYYIATAPIVINPQKKTLYGYEKLNTLYFSICSDYIATLTSLLIHKKKHYMTV